VITRKENGEREIFDKKIKVGDSIYIETGEGIIKGEIVEVEGKEF
jgi:sortase (surface protein transpeptidase)